MYTEEVLKHFKQPHNYGKINNPDGIGKVGNLRCGDVMWMYIKIGKNSQGKEIISNIKFETFGCVAAIATSSAATRLVKGKTIQEALKIGSRDIVDHLGNLPTIKVHCSLLAHDAIAEAIYDFLSKNKRKIPKELEKRHETIEKERILAEKGHKH